MFVVIEGPDAEDAEETGAGETGRAPLHVVEERPAPSPRDWSNVVFSPAFCEEARRNWRGRAAS